MRAAPIALVTLVLGFALPTAPVRAADSSTEEARQHFLKGQQFFELARWDEAIAEFEQAYAARSDPTFIYNMAQAYRRKGDAKKALDLYKNYLIKAPKSMQRAEVEERIAALQKQVEEAERTSRSSAPAPAYVPAPVSPPAPSPEPVAAPPLPGQAAEPAIPAPTPPPAVAEPVAAAAPAYVQAPAAPPPSPGRGMRVAGIVLGAVGVAAIGAGVFLSLETDDYNSTVQNAPIYNPNFDDRGKLYNTLQWVGYGLGAGLLATGAVLYGMGVSAAKAGAVAVAPAVLPGGAGLCARGAF
jgi:tetratricopeptide (TPR) repeat protein